MAEPLTINVQQAAKAAPAVYTVPGAVEVEPLSAFATFDGAGAASAFLPTMTFRSSAGLILARVFPGSSVAAGGTADVTFAPFLGDTSAAVASGAPVYAYLEQFTATSVASGASHPCVWEVFRTNSLFTGAGSSGVFSTGSTVAVVNATGDRFLQVHQPGVLLITSKALWDKATAPFLQEQFPASDATLLFLNEFTWTSYDQSVAAANVATEYPSSWLVGASDLVAAPQFKRFGYNVRQTSGAAVNLSSSIMSAVFWPMTSDFAGVDIVY